MIKFVLFDLDGTLLPMDHEMFVKSYFTGLGKKMIPYGFDANKVVDAVRQGVFAMIKNNGLKTNEEVFWENFSELLGNEILGYKEVFEDYYRNEFQELKNICRFEPMAKEVVDLAKSRGFKVVLATSPMFPRIATESRLKWAGFETSDFELVSTYEDYAFAKPSLEYYSAVLEKIGAKPSECVMIGNDALEDMVAEKLGLDVFLLTDCLINRKELDISKFKNGSFVELKEYIKGI